MFMRIGKPNSDNEDQAGNRTLKNSSRPVLITMIAAFLILVFLTFLVVNLPGRYKAIVVGEGAPDELLVLDTVKGNAWRYQCTRDVTVITYLGKFRAGEKIPERIVIKQR